MKIRTRIFFVILYLAFSAFVICTHKDNKYVRFDMEGYDKIVQNYWMKPGAYGLPHMFQLGVQKVTGHLPLLRSNDRTGTEEMLEAAIMSTTSPAAKKNVSATVLALVLYNLLPIGRNYLYSAEQVTALRQEVSNVNPAVNLYTDLGVSASSSIKEIAQTYQKQIAVLSHATSSADKEKAQQITYANKVLSNPNTRSLYDAAEIQPTVFSQIIGDTLYIHMKEMSPTTPQEFYWAVNSASSSDSVDSMIIDLRGNIGGSIDVGRGLAGFFLGNDLDAIDFYHQGRYVATSTIFFWKLDQLNKYHQIAVLTDGFTQSTAEIFTEVLQSSKTAYVVGSTTRGWGTVENTYPLKTVLGSTTDFTLYLVNSLTLRSDRQPIEGRGITPDVDVSQAGWQDKLSALFSSASLINAVESTVTQQPLE